MTILYINITRASLNGENGIRSSSKRTSHANIRYYFITDSITKQELSIKICPTLDMIGDYLTKTLQGSQFCCICNTIIGIHEDDIPSYNISGRAFIEERKIKLEGDKEDDQKAAKFQSYDATKECVGRN